MILSIAMDGPVGAGKSTVADEAAKRLNILHLDTGAMYRAVGLYIMQAGVDCADEQAVTALISRGVDIDVKYVKGRQQTLLNGRDVSGVIRTQEAGTAASCVSKYASVRKMLVEKQRALAKTQSMLVDGRDIGTVVLPDAKLKIFITASAEARAKRRHLQLKDSGDKTPLETVRAEIEARDLQDTTRALDPLKMAEDAVLLDTTNMTQKQAADAVIELVERVYGKQ